MDITTETPAVAAPQDEATALKTLIALINDRTTLPLDSTSALQAHLVAFPQSPGELAQKIDRSRSWVIQELGFAKLPEDVKAKAKEDRTSFSDLRSIQAALSSSNTKSNTSNSSSPTSNNESNKVISSNNKSNSEFRQSPASTTGYPLIRDTVDELVKLLTFWRQQLNLGQVVERWLIYLGQIGWLRTGVSALAIGLAGYGGWQATLNAERGIRNAEGGNLNNEPSSALRAPHSALSSSALPAPNLTEHRLVAGNHMLLRWAPPPACTAPPSEAGGGVGPSCTYRVYWHGPDGTMEAVDQDVTATGVTVNRQSVTGNEKGFLTVTAISPNQTESAPSQSVEYDLTPLNEEHLSWVKPLAQLATSNAERGTGNAESIVRHSRESGNPASAKTYGPPLTTRGGDVNNTTHTDTLSAPSDVHFQLKTPNVIYVSWRAVGPGVTYNLYSSASSNLTPLRKENRQPLKQNVVTWIPETGLEQYWLVVTALDAQNHESAYSEAIEVVRHPEKTDNAELLVSAGQLIKKVVPW